MPQPPKSPLFPYTTLFRSQSQSQRGGTMQCRLPIGLARKMMCFIEDDQAKSMPHLRHVRVCTVVDRKSTRLNSSHMSISYAVFCLKKKNRKHVHCDRASVF